MFESAELGHKLSKETFKQREPVLRERLLKLQYQLLEKAKFPVLVIIGGVDGAGKGETANILNEWMDPRHIRTHAFGPAEGDSVVRAPMRFWQALPGKGRIGVLFGSWYTDPIVARAEGILKRARFERSIERIRDFETMLADEGTLILKFWFHLGKDAQKKRLTLLEKDKRTRWRVTPDDWHRFKRYDQYRAVSEYALRETSTGHAPWHIIDGSDAEFRYLTAGEILADALEKRLTAKPPKPDLSAPPAEPALDGRNVLNTLDYDTVISDKDYGHRLEVSQGTLALATRSRAFRKRRLVLVFEGMDAAGKGGTIRRITQALDARRYRVIPIAAPSEEERAQPYLWRFWRHVPPPAHTAIFDRSWYGRVLVERVEGFCSPDDWQRAYREINEFEEEMADMGAIVLKFWLAITQDEQLRRFKERETVAYKRFKITPEDWRNRKKWPAYERAVIDMLGRTSTAHAPWHVIGSNDQPTARVRVLETIAEHLSR